MSLEVPRGRPGKETAPSDRTASRVTPTAVTWSAEAQRVLGILSRTGQTFTADTLTQLAGYPPNPHQLGAAFAHAKQASVIEPVSACVSAEDGRLLRVWVRCHR
jgi:hypothetical protein